MLEEYKFQINTELKNNLETYLELTGINTTEFFNDIVTRGISKAMDSSGNIAKKSVFYNRAGEKVPALFVEKTTMFGQEYVKLYIPTDDDIIKVPAFEVQYE